MTESNLHFRVIQNKLIAELPKYLDLAKLELDYAWKLDVPHNPGTLRDYLLFNLLAS